jgi:hypothetical protein
VRTADALRKNLNAVIYSRLPGHSYHPQRTPQDVRVNISVLSTDQTNVFYISRTPGSSLKPFGKRSVAWVSVFTGKIRWYKKSYSDNQDLFRQIVLFDNTDGTIAGDEQKIHLSSHYQERDQDYEAFVQFPVPSPQRGFESGYVKGAIHVSFRRETDFASLWKGDKLDPTTQEPTYREPGKMLEDWCSDDEVRGALRSAVAALSELLRGFNEVIYQSYLNPNRSV